jgi:hypothetical protein
MNDDINRDIPDDELDRLIGAALVVDADALGVERLKRYWRVESRRDRWQRRAYFALTTAAAALVLIGLLVVARDGDEDAKTASVAREQAPVRANAEQAQGIATEELDHEAASRLAGRAPTEYERFIFIARTGKPMPAMAEIKVDASKGPRPASTEEVLAEIEETGGVEGLVRAAKRAREPQLQRTAIARLLEIATDEALLGYLALVRDGTTRSAALVAADADSQLPLASMLAFLDHDDRAVRRSAAFVLGHVNGPEVTQALIARVTEEPSGATETWMALMECRGEMAQQFVAYAATRPQLLGHLNGARVQLAYVVP